MFKTVICTIFLFFSSFVFSETIDITLPEKGILEKPLIIVNNQINTPYASKISFDESNNEIYKMSTVNSGYTISIFKYKNGYVLEGNVSSIKPMNTQLPFAPPIQSTQVSYIQITNDGIYRLCKDEDKLKWESVSSDCKNKIDINLKLIN